MAETFIELRLDALERQVSSLRQQVEELTLIACPKVDGLTPKEAAPLLGFSHSTLFSRLRESVNFPEKSALKEGIHFERKGNRWRILNLVETKKAIAENDVIFGRRKPLKGEKSDDHKCSD